MNTLTHNNLQKENFHTKQAYSTLLQGVLEGFMDGVLVLTAQREWVHGNKYACQICQQLQDSSQPNSVPKEIWRNCQALIDSREFYGNQSVIIESEITIDHSTAFRVRTRWLQLEFSEDPCILITIEDQRQSLRNIAIAEGFKYNLTPREAEVWSLRRVNYSYKEIAAELFISLNTVKKHLKNIHAKQEMALGCQAS